ncbi:UDP-N-acetylmuramate--L-alanine ligase [Nesterenkonia sp. NBAIMH1]|uniref:UDP-N-acetylmuramate--L-alanine ligase n=1 Tax=Nesterenkonia sp. NBAIMH1 TaxID=2600320 RepID=UPI0011B55C5D|nr:UDP-N-acetylmuramate--L-alanine ligase [Nesterenkonia sp. NBAIMH1]
MSSLSQLGRVHFLGMAGVGVSAIARLMLAEGVPVSGTDGKDLPVLREFRDAGVPVRVGYAEDNIRSVEEETGTTIDTVVASSVAKAGRNVEYDAAAAAGKRMLHRSEGLAACMSAKRGIAVAGTHGKTTTSSMTAVMLSAAGLEPSFAIGATVSGFGTNAQAGAGQWFVAEADESDGTLVNYCPEIAIVTNVEPDHLDHYASAEEFEQVFVTFVGNILPGGALVLCADDDGARSLGRKVAGGLESKGGSVLTYGFAADAGLRLSDHSDGADGQRFTLSCHDETAQVVLAAPGRHNALNAAAAVGAGLCAGMALSDAAEAVSSFAGSSRRFEKRGEIAGIRVIDDYAHHPTELAAVLSAARSAVGAGAVHAIFQPHLFTRTEAFAKEFGEELRRADTAAVLEIYPAREEPIEGVTAELLGHPVLQRQAAVDQAVRAAQPGDIILTLGAGDVTELGDDIVEGLRQARPAEGGAVDGP